MSHRNKHDHPRSNTGGIIAIMLTIVVTGGLIYIGLSNQRSSTSTQNQDSAANPSDMVGKPAPDFSLSDSNGTTYSLAGLKGKKVVLFFNEGIMCYPACWNQVASLGQDKRFQQPDTVALSVVTDSAIAWQKAVEKMPELAQATVVHDTDAQTSSAYGALTTKSSMHYGQLPGHTYVIIDQQGIVRHVFDDPNMAIHNDTLMKELEKLTSS